MKYRVTLSYDGSKFYGFQRLNYHETVQKTLEEALSKIDQNEVMIKGAGRTDRGVHANGQVIHFHLLHNIPPIGLKSILDKLVGPYIHIRSCEEASDGFHARFSVVSKTYIYRIYFGEYNPILYDYYFECSDIPNIELMKQASNLFLGVHDFRNFVSGERDNYTSIINDIQFYSHDKDYLDIIFIGKSFYRYMVRNIVGALLDVGFGKRSFEEVEVALSGVLVKQFTTAVSSGLYLHSIDY